MRKTACVVKARQSDADIAIVRARLGDLLLTALGLALAGLLLYAHVLVVGLVFLAVAVVWLLSRLRVAEPGPLAGAFARRSGWLLFARATALFLIYVGICVAFFVGRAEHWANQTPGQVAIYSMAGLAFFLLREIRQTRDAAFNHFDGGRSEQEVGALLAEFGDDWKIINNFVRDDGYGNIDHVVWAPSGEVYAIETKSGAFRRDSLRQAAWNAAWLKNKLDVRWVTGIVCLPESTPPRWEGVVCALGQPELLDWLREPSECPERERWRASSRRSVARRSLPQPSRQG